MDYERLYKDALSRAKYYHDRDNVQFLENIFPELAEPEDERIRKAIISFLKSPFVNENITDEKVAPWLAWLEKQGEHKPTDNSIDVFIKKAWDYISRHQLEYNDYDDFKSHMKGE